MKLPSTMSGIFSCYSIPILSVAVLISIFTSCTKSEVTQLAVDIPVADKKIVDVFNLSNGTQVFRDTLHEQTVTLDSLNYGIHLVTILWDRHILTPDEYRGLRPQTLDEQKHYALQKFIFIDPKESGNIRLYTEDIDQNTLEELLLTKESSVIPFMTTARKQTLLYEAYESILHGYRKRFSQQKDSLQKLLYTHNDRGHLEQASAVNRQIKNLWEDHIVPAYEEEEKQFLITHADQIIVPFILLNQINSPELYESLKPVITAMPEKYQKLRFIQELAKLRNK